ncbi:hypothetical protein E8E13_009745 [Curvularia kusanoi]|uniref:Cadmium resistance transporter n=1 Tax=Curvularia kusanoi TaxID=90978 RepID=A0A9P4WD11_CURKU|nr:hypothetical protein E8E13_009745 [Curvularia kusanoi]
MQFGKAVGTACSSFIVTNIDDLFVLVTFFAEASISKNVTPVKITIGQYLGFTVIVAISMVGFGAALVLPSEPIGFLGLLPVLLGVWNMCDLVFKDGGEEEEGLQEEDGAAGGAKVASMKSILKVSLVVCANGADNVGTYIPLFSQAKGAEIAVYVVVYNILLGVWCLAAFLIMKQKHIFRMAQKYASVVIPFLYMGLGIFIIVKSSCYPWSIEHIDNSVSSHPGKIIMGVVTTIVLFACIGAMLWIKVRKAAAQSPSDVSIAGQEPEASGSSIAS